jgi:hypothetical protein
MVEEDSEVVDANEDKHNDACVLTAEQAWCLYVSHFFSMWTSRTYEHGAVRVP